MKYIFLVVGFLALFVTSLFYDYLFIAIPGFAVLVGCVIAFVELHNKGKEKTIEDPMIARLRKEMARELAIENIQEAQRQEKLKQSEMLEELKMLREYRDRIDNSSPKEFLEMFFDKEIADKYKDEFDKDEDLFRHKYLRDNSDDNFNGNGH